MGRRRRRTTRVVPGAGRLISSLRDLGYHPEEAVADLVDNSVAAGARRVDVTVEFNGEQSWVRIADDGRGMNASTITEAMRYGSARDYDDDDLGKFGLGLKTASMSQCRRLTVASRPSRTSMRAEVRQLDLDFVEEHDDWDIIILGVDERPASVVEPLRDHRGTVVLWEHLDRILTYRDPSGGWARRRLNALAGSIEEHLSIVFHRFLAGEVPRRRLELWVNGNRLEPWDPFARSEPATETLKAEDFALSTASGSGIVRIEPFVLPPKASFSSESAWRRLSGPSNWNRQQGFYVYRANRLVQSGGWSYMRTADEHTKLARIALMFGPELDAAFGINVAKMRVSLPQELRDLIEESVSRSVRRARAVYDAKPDEPRRRTVGSGSSRTGSGTRGTHRDAQGRRRALLRAAKAVGEAKAFERVMRELARQNREVARDLGW